MLQRAVELAELLGLLLGGLHLVDPDIALLSSLVEMVCARHGDERRVERRRLTLADVGTHELVVVGQHQHSAHLVALVRCEELIDALGAAVGRAKEPLLAQLRVDHRVEERERRVLGVVTPLQVAHQYAPGLAILSEDARGRPLRVVQREVAERLRHVVRHHRHRFATVRRLATGRAPKLIGVAAFAATTTASALVSCVVAVADTLSPVASAAGALTPAVPRLATQRGECIVRKADHRAKVGVPLAKLPLDHPLGKEQPLGQLVGRGGLVRGARGTLRAHVAARHVRDCRQAGDFERLGLLVELVREQLRPLLRDQTLAVERRLALRGALVS